MKLTMSQFKGTAPKIDPALLPEDMGQKARNLSLFSGAIKPERRDKIITSVPSDTQSIYLYDDGTESKWYYWDKKVKVVKDFVYQDEYNRIIVQGADEELLITDSTLLGASFSKTVDRSNAYVLGIPRLGSFSMEVTGSGTENVETRSYIVALVRTWTDGKIDVGGLSEPAQTFAGEVTVNVASGQRVNLTDIYVPADVLSSTGASELYIYRSEVGTSTVGYSYVDSIPVDTSVNTYSYTDEVASVDLGESAVSQYWDAPEQDLKGLLPLNNGILACYKNQTVYFSYPYQSYAFPVTYSVPIDSPIVGLGAFGNTVVVCTKSNPVMILVTDPAAPTVTPIQRSLPCLDEGSIINTASGVIYLAPTGLAQIDSYTFDLISKNIVSSDDYYGINTTDISSVLHDNFYYMLFGDKSREFGFKLNLDDLDSGFTTFLTDYKLLWVDPETNILYGVKTNSTILDSFNTRNSTQLDLVEIEGDRDFFKTCMWKSKLFTSAQGIVTFSCARLDIDFEGVEPPEPEVTYFPINNSINKLPVNITSLNGTTNNRDYLTAIGKHTSILFSYFVDKVLRYTKYLDSNRPFRLPSGFMGRRFEVQVESNKPVRSITLATSMGELT